MGYIVILESHAFKFKNGVYVEVFPSMYGGKTDFKYYIGNRNVWDTTFEIPFTRKVELRKTALATIRKQPDLKKGEEIVTELHSTVFRDTSTNQQNNVIFTQVKKNITRISISNVHINKSIPISHIAELKEEAIKILSGGSKNEGKIVNSNSMFNNYIFK